MSLDQVMRACGTVASLYLVGFAVSAMTLASIGAVGLTNSSLCSGHDCGAVFASHQHLMPVSEPTPYHAVLAAPLILLDN